MGKTLCQFTFNFSYMYLTDYEKLMCYLKIVLSFLRAAMFCNTFCCLFKKIIQKKKEILIQRLDLLELYSNAGSAKVLLQQITSTKPCHL